MNFKLLSCVAFILIFSSCNSSTDRTPTQQPVAQEEVALPVKALTGQEAKSLLLAQPAIVRMDVRTGEEYAGGHLQEATNLDYKAPDFATQLSTLDKTKPYLVYCAVGGRSSKASKLMHEMGFINVYNASEGFNALKEAGIPVAMLP